MKKKYAFVIALISLLTVCLSSCDLFHPGTPVPGYIHIDKINVTTDYPTQGSNSSKISDAWVYVDDQLIGCFELPATFPVIAEGVHEVKVKPGIKVNGISANRSPYPFYTIYSQQIDFEPGKIITLTPTVTYTSTSHFELLEDFEQAGTHLDSTIHSNSNIDTIGFPASNVFEGNAAGIITTTPLRPFVEVATIYPRYVLPKANAPIFLEFNYRCNYEFTLSIYAWGSTTVSQFTVLHLHPNPEWNKIYCYLSPNVSAANSAVDYQIALGMLNATGADSTYVLLDNIKLVH
ncbi:MAG: hypothetical protein ACJ77K_04435 [Bacteroidia bacterium]